MKEDSCLERSAIQKEASGISVFLLEELGDARLRCAQLKKYVDEAVELINKSKHRDHFFEEAAHLIYGVPDTLVRMDKALNAAALAASKLDYEEIKDTLRPEKVEELEEALKDVRIRRVRKQSGEEPMKIQEAVTTIELIAAEAESAGKVDTRKLADLIVGLEKGATQKTAMGAEFAGTLRELAANLLGERPSRLALATTLRTMLASTMDLVTAAFHPLKIRNKQYGEGVPSEVFQGALNQAAENIYMCLGTNSTVDQALEDALVGFNARIGPLTGMPSALIERARKISKEHINVANAMRGVARDMEWLASDMKKTEPAELRYDRVAAEHEAEKEIESRFEEGKPADPTESMSPEDAKKWREMNEEHKDQFKSAGAKDQLVDDPDLMPRAIARFYGRELERRIGGGTQVRVLKSETTMPRGWSFGNYTLLEITLPNEEKLKGAFTLNVAPNEATGVAVLDAPYGTITVPRASDPKRILNWIADEVGSSLKKLVGE